MKQAILFLVLAMALLPLQADLFFSEYIEGSSNNKALEIYNPGTVGVDLDNYYILVLNNGNYTWDSPRYTIDIEGTVAPDDVWVICNESAVTEIQTVSDSIGSSATYFNGDDGVGLFYYDGATWTMLDVIGTEADPGSGWEVAGVANATAEHTLVRKDTVTTGATDWAVSAGTNADDSQWIVFDQNTFSYLGWHGDPGNLAPTIANVTVTPEVPEPTETVVITADVTDAARSVASVTLDWGTDGSTYPNNIPMSLTAAPTYTTNSPIPAHTDGTTVYFRITATDDESESAEYFGDYTVFEPAGVVSIYDIQGQAAASPYAGTGQVLTSLGVVTGADQYGFFLQDGAGAWNGVYCYDSDHTAVIGDSIEVSGQVVEYSDLTEIEVTTYTVINQGNALPAPAAVSTADAMTEPYENVLVSISNATCIAGPDSYNQWIVDDGSGEAMIDDGIYEYTPVSVGSVYNITGVNTYKYGSFRIYPRDANDVEVLQDENPPVILDVTVVNETTVNVQFNEELEVDSAEEPTNYYISTRLVSISDASLDGADPSLVVLTVSGMVAGAYTIEVTDVEDLAGNACDGETYDFSYAPPQPAPAVIITEIMQNPAAVGDTAGEYFEIYNNDTVVVDMTGWTFFDNGSNTFTVEASGGTVTVNPGEYFVFGLNADFATNGGVNIDYTYSGMSLGNGDDELIIVMADGTTEVDRAEWDGGSVWPDPTGASMQFMGAWTDDNNDGTLWQAATTAWPGGAGDFGTPGLANAGALIAPENLMITISDNDAVLTWSEVTGATTYHVYRGASPDNLTQLADTAELTYTDIDAGAETKYYYYVTAE